MSQVMQQQKSTISLKFDSLVIGCTGLLGGFCLMLVRGLNGFPLNADHSYFLPISFYFKATGHLDNPWLNPIDSHVFNWHGFLQPWLIAMLAPGNDWAWVGFGLNLLAFGTFVIVLVATQRLGLGRIEAASIGLITLALLLDIRSRPEVLSTLLTTLLVLLMAMRTAPLFAGKLQAMAGGALFALLMCSHPAIFGLSAVFFSIYALAMIVRERPALAQVLVSAALMAATFALVAFILVQFVLGMPVTLWLDGILHHAAKTAARQDVSAFASYFVMNRFLPGIVLGFLLLVPVGWRFWQVQAPARPGAPAWRLVQAVLILALAVMIYRVAVRVPATYYNFSGLLAALALAACLAASGLPLIEKALRLTLVAMGGLAMAGIVLWLGQNAYDGPAIAPTAAALRADIQREISAGRRVCADASVLSTLPDLAQALQLHIAVPASDEEQFPSRAQCDTYVRLQPQLYSAAPAPIAQFTLTSEHFIAHPAMLGWMRPLYYGYAVYH